jgi:hypothetical protein
MKKRTFIAFVAALAIGTCCLVTPLAAQRGTPPYRGPRAADGHPDLSGIWQAFSTANWDLEDHSPSPPQLYQMGARGATPGGQGVVEGGDIPYNPPLLKPGRRTSRIVSHSIRK